LGEKTLLLGDRTFELGPSILRTSGGSHVPLRAQSARVLSILANNHGELVTATV
jgi:DNA-binding winged helix-turn-helix (wHTH) protein